MKPFLYNPKVGGREFLWKKKTIKTDEYINCSEEEAITLKASYHFLVDMRLPQYQPDWHRIKTSKKSPWDILKAKIFGSQ